MPSLKLTAITPQHMPTAKEFRQAFEKAVQKTARLVERDLKSTTRTWKHQPEFDVVVEPTGDDYTVAAGTDDRIYGYVDQGTEPHIIRPRRSPYLRFQVGGSPKTRAGIIGSRAGSRGSQWRSAPFVLHPGTTARNFTKKIGERRQKTLEQEISQGIAKIMRTQR